MKPVRIFLFFFLLLVVLIGGYAFLPSVISIPWGGSFANPVRSFAERVFKPTPQRILPVVNAIQDSMTFSLRKPILRRPPMKFRDSLIRSTPSLEYPDHVAETWHDLIRYYSGLTKNNLTSHILYYGDSQIEGDRITYQLRDSLQHWFGGGGPGLFLPVMTVPATHSLILNAGPVWKREACDLHQKIPFPLSSTGIFMEHVAFLPDTAKPLPQKASFTVSWQSFASPNIRSADKYRLWFHGTKGREMLSIKTGNTVHTREISSDSSLQTISGKTGNIVRGLSITIESETPFIIEGVSLERDPGIMVDNIPLRGRSMVAFSKADRDCLSLMIKELDVRLIILQFGLNVIAGGEKEVSRFAGRLHTQLAVLKGISPEIMVIIVGTTDMNRSSADPDSLPIKLRDIQREVALNEGCLFWDSFRAMGGYGSARKWLNQNPSLMRPDAVHLSREGSQLLTTMFITALKQEVAPIPGSTFTETPHP